MGIYSYPFRMVKEAYLPIHTGEEEEEDVKSEMPENLEENITPVASVQHASYIPQRRRRSYLHSILRSLLLLLTFWGLLAIYLHTMSLFGWRFTRAGGDGGGEGGSSSSSSSSSDPHPNQGQTHHTAPQISITYDVYRPSTLPPGLNLCDCGPDLATATSRGCVYDTLAAGWLPPHCRDKELTQIFEHSGPGPNGRWEYFADANGTQPLGVEELGALGPVRGKFWASRDWHLAHCLFYWEKYTRMRATGTVMERKFDSEKHVQHCRGLAMNPHPNRERLLHVPVSMNGDVEDVDGEEHRHGDHAGHDH